MAMTPEAKVKKQVTRQVDAMGADYFYPVTGGYGRSGVPDIVGCYKGSFFGIECKAGKGKPTPLQDKNLKDINIYDLKFYYYIPLKLFFYYPSYFVY